MNRVIRRKRRLKAALPIFKRRRVLVRKGKGVCLMSRFDYQRELNRTSPTVGQVEYLRKIAAIADSHLGRAESMIDVIALAVTNPEFGNGRIGGDTIADNLAVVLIEMELVRSALYPKELQNVRH